MQFKAMMDFQIESGNPCKRRAEAETTSLACRVHVFGIRERSYLAEGWLSGIHLVNTDNQLFDSERERQQGVLASLAIFGDSCLKLAGTSRNDQHGTIRL